MAAVETKARPKVLGIIPARGGSKGLARKNILPLAGKPLIAYTIECAIRSSQLDRVVVSTEDHEIASVARAYGADVPFSRPTELSGDDTLIYPVLTHAVEWLGENQGYKPDFVMLLQPTSPLRAVNDIDAAVGLAVTAGAESVVSVSPVQQHPYWTKQITEDGRLTNYLPLNHMPLRRQELPPVYMLNGAVYLVKSKVLVEQQTFYTGRTYAYVMPQERSLDIDSKWDLYLAELILQDRKRNERD